MVGNWDCKFSELMWHTYTLYARQVYLSCVGEEAQRAVNLGSSWASQWGADAVCVVCIHLKS